MSAMTDTVTHDAARRRYELATPAGTAFAVYHLDGEVAVVTHSEVPAALWGRGTGSTLVRGMLDSMRAEGRKLRPRCSFVAAYVQRHPEYRDLVG